MAWDRYAYGLNNPSRYVDPSGHIACDELGTEDCDEEGNYTNEDISGPTVPVASFLWIMANKIHDKLAHVDDVEAMAQIADLVTTFYDDPATAFSFLSNVFNGVYSYNPLTLLEAAINRELNPEHSGLGFGAKGFHPDFWDKGDQVFHVWPYIVQGASGLIGGPIGAWGNIFHEYGPFDKGGQSQRDYDLSNSGLILGTLIHYGYVPLDQLVNAIRYMFGTKGPGSLTP